MIKRKGFLRIVIPIAIVFTAVVLVLIYAFVWRAPSAREVYSNVQSCVVELKSTTTDNNSAYGSAVLIDDSGTLISNAHMVAYKQGGAYKLFDTLEIRFSFETDYRKVSLVKYDTNNDIAILKLEDMASLTLTPIKLADSTEIRAGGKVYAVGNGQNQGLAISQGIIGIPLINMEYDGITRSVIQCDLTIAEGNSGGALLDEFGKLIGITTFRTKDNKGNVIYGVAYSVPINIAMDYANSKE